MATFDRYSVAPNLVRDSDQEATNGLVLQELLRILSVCGTYKWGEGVACITREAGMEGVITGW